MVISSNPGLVYWMDIFSHLFLVKIVMCFKKTKINEKEAGVGPIFKKELKPQLECSTNLSSATAAAAQQQQQQQQHKRDQLLNVCNKNDKTIFFMNIFSTSLKTKLPWMPKCLPNLQQKF